EKQHLRQRHQHRCKIRWNSPHSFQPTALPVIPPPSFSPVKGEERKKANEELKLCLVASAVPRHSGLYFIPPPISAVPILLRARCRSPVVRRRTNQSLGARLQVNRHLVVHQQRAENDFAKNCSLACVLPPHCAQKNHCRVALV